MNESVLELYSTLLKKYRNLSIREKGMIVFLVLFFIFYGSYYAGMAVVQVFTAQNKRLETVEKYRKALPYRLEELAQLKVRKDAVEKAYHKVEVSEGVKSHLESLLLEKESINKTYNFEITDKELKQFGGNYEQAAFLLKFRISKFAELIDLLKELVKGKKPVLLKKIFIRKTPRGDWLDVQLDVTSIRRIQT